MAREGVPLIVIQRQLGHTNLGITSIYLSARVGHSACPTAGLSHRALRRVGLREW